MHALQLPDRLDGLRVIDVGAYEGYFSFQCERLGASQIVSAHKLIWNWPGSTVLDRFRFAKRVTNSIAEEVHVSVEELSPETVGLFDVSLFLGLLYHAPNMIEYLQKVRSITTHLAVIETLVDMLDVEQPCAAFYPPAFLNGDSSNHWGPNLACVEGMLSRVGFSDVRFMGLWDANTRAPLTGEDPSRGLKSGRAVWHAYV
jgi:tRNA (mo5U34)-methyltransferase